MFFALLIVAALSYALYGLLLVLNGCPHCQGLTDTDGRQIMPGVSWTTICEVSGIQIRPKLGVAAIVTAIVLYMLFIGKSTSSTTTTTTTQQPVQFSRHRRHRDHHRNNGSSSGGRRRLNVLPSDRQFVLSPV
jgi:hypothetical protein